MLPFNGKPRGRNGGRKAKRPRGKRGVAHEVRPAIDRRTPAHVCCRIERGLGNLRGRREMGVVRECFRRGRERFGFRLVHYSVQRDHVHMIVEAESKRALTRGMKGLCVRMARALNRLWSRCGRVFRERFFLALLRSPRQLRNALVYVLRNGRKHGEVAIGQDDPCSSMAAFGERDDRLIGDPEKVGTASKRLGDRAGTRARDSLGVSAARTWLLRTGWWRRGGGWLRASEEPAGSAGRR
jgi:REP element-mobilizing transposase RayT